jgi:tRNA(Arg) A34 adenosine deaminase TadA
LGCDRRVVVAGAAAAIALFAGAPRAAHALTDAERRFVAEAERMRDEAVARGDQAFGAVLVMEGAIVGWGPSRVVSERNPDAHAERVALWDAQRRLGRQDLSGAVIFSTWRPCGACQNALALANVAGMRHGPAATDAGAPRRW